MNRHLCFALLISVGCMLWGCSSETQNPVSSDTPIRGELKALYKTIPEPKNVTAVVSGFTVTISWDSVANASRYHVVILKGTSKYLDDTMQVSRQIILTNVPAGGYSVTIAGLIVHEGKASEEGTASTPLLFNTIPAPKNVTAVASGSTVTISWDSVATASRYHVVILKGTGKYLNDTMQVSRQIVLTNVPGGSYSVTIAGIVVSQSGPSAEGTISTPVLFNIIPDPKNVTAVVNGFTVTISWDSVATASRYHVVILKGTSTYLNDTMQVSRQIVLTNVPAGGYIVTIAGIVVSQSGPSAEGAASTPLLFTVSSVVAPTVTVTASSIPFCPRNGKWVTVNFSGVVTNTEGGASYELKDEYKKIHYIGTVPAGPYSVKLKLKDSRKGYDRDGRQYTFIITATNSAGTAKASVTVTVPREKKQRGWDDDGDDDDDDDWGNR